MNWRDALVLGAIFVVVGIIYWSCRAAVPTPTGPAPTMLIVLGIAMAFGFAVLLRGSREL